MTFWMLIWSFLGLALLVLPIVGTVWLIGRPTNQSDPNPAVDSPQEILRRRFAPGEIDEDKYLRLRAGLQE